MFILVIQKLKLIIAEYKEEEKKRINGDVKEDNRYKRFVNWRK